GLEWDQFVNLSFSDFYVGLDIGAYRRIALTASLFGLRVENSHVALRINGDYLDSRVGLNLANGVLHANQGADPMPLQIADNSGASLLLNGVTLGGGAATALELTGNDYVQCNNCTFDSWTGPYAVRANRGTLALQGCAFSGQLSPTRRGVQLLPGLASA